MRVPDRGPITLTYRRRLGILPERSMTKLKYKVSSRAIDRARRTVGQVSASAWQKSRGAAAHDDAKCPGASETYVGVVTLVRVWKPPPDPYFEVAGRDHRGD
jgi:hypothetical protein